MAEYIKQKIQGGKKSICDSCTHRNVCKAIDNQPCTECNHYQCAADVEPVKRGRWGKVYKSKVTVSDGYVSSCCDMWNERKSNFCPNCGARMDEEVKHER